VLAIVSVPVCYLAVAVAGAVLLRNAGWQEPEAGIEIFVRTNGVHVDLVMPARAADVDWYALAPPSHVEAPNAADGWVAIGWGQREFYLETQSFADLRFGTASRAILGGDALMHVQHGSQPTATYRYRPLRLDPEGFRRMADAITRSFRVDAHGQAIPLLGRGYGADDVFYEAHGTYHAFRTSNQWSGDMLAEAGVAIGIWTPFSQSIMWRFRR
jgi:uncharacterized protein (TIGR02117 family)